MNPMTKEEIDSYFATKRETAKQEAKNDLDKPASKLLTDINDESLDRMRPEGETVARTMARFAALQVALSKEADVTASKNLKAAEASKSIAWIALAIASAAFVLQIVEFALKK